MDGCEFSDFLGGVCRAFEAGQERNIAIAQELNRFEELIHRVDAKKAKKAFKAEVPGLIHLASALDLAEASDSFGLTDGLRRIANRLNWSQFYVEDDWNRGFIDRVANGSLVGPIGIIESEELVLDVFLLGPDTLYPPHGHAAIEIYYILGGHPRFLVGNLPWKEKPPGSFSFHPSGVVHATRTFREPMLAIIAWRGDIQSPSWHMSDRSQSGDRSNNLKRLW